MNNRNYCGTRNAPIHIGLQIIKRTGVINTQWEPLKTGTFDDLTHVLKSF